MKPKLLQKVTAVRVKVLEGRVLKLTEECAALRAFVKPGRDDHRPLGRVLARAEAELEKARAELESAAILVTGKPAAPVATLGTVLVAAPRFSDEELSAAFDLVKNKRHWKEPIRCTIRVSDDPEVAQRQLWLIEDAVVHFTGGTAEVQRVNANTYKIRAAGYYAVMGA